MSKLGNVLITSDGISAGKELGRDCPNSVRVASDLAGRGFGLVFDMNVDGRRVDALLDTGLLGQVISKNSLAAVASKNEKLVRKTFMDAAGATEADVVEKISKISFGGESWDVEYFVRPSTSIAFEYSIGANILKNKSIFLGFDDGVACVF